MEDDEAEEIKDEDIVQEDSNEDENIETNNGGELDVVEAKKEDIDI